MPYHYTPGGVRLRPTLAVSSFEFHRFRLQFQAIDTVEFPPGRSANAIRGAFGTILREASLPQQYARLFSPRSSGGPSGLAESPRPFVFRTANLDGARIPAGEHLWFDVHVFELREQVLPVLRDVLGQLAIHGIGMGRGRSRLVRTEALDLADRSVTVVDDPGPPISVPLEGDDQGVNSVRVRFASPTALKVGGKVAGEPEFGVLFARLRDRIAMLRSLYGRGPLDIDYQELGRRANQVHLERSDLCWEYDSRTSSRTGQVHAIAGFTGEASYRGRVDEFLPWLRAARWVGVGRQTVWGNGDVRVVETAPELT